jgi:hypothetical protein
MNVSRLKKAGVAPHEKVDSLLIDHESEKLVRTYKFVTVSLRALSSAQIASRVVPSLAKHGRLLRRSVRLLAGNE